jgi:hypothetical protein
MRYKDLRLTAEQYENNNPAVTSETFKVCSCFLFALLHLVAPRV